MEENADEVVKMLKDMNLNKDVCDVFLRNEYLGLHLNGLIIMLCVTIGPKL